MRGKNNGISKTSRRLIVKRPTKNAQLNRPDKSYGKLFRGSPPKRPQAEGGTFTNEIPTEKADSWGEQEAGDSAFSLSRGAEELSRETPTMPFISFRGQRGDSSILQPPRHRHSPPGRTHRGKAPRPKGLDSCLSPVSPRNPRIAPRGESLGATQMTVRPVLGEVGRYWVGSETNEHARHLCDIIENQCGCPDYVCRRAAYQREFKRPYRCKHLLAAREYCLDDFIDVMKEAALKQ